MSRTTSGFRRTARAAAVLTLATLGSATLAAEPPGAASAPEAPARDATSAAGPASDGSAPPAYALDPTHTFVHWTVLHMGTSTIHGRFERVAGNVQFDAKAHRLDLGITVDTASVSTGVAPLDTLLRGPELLGSAAWPQAFFVARDAFWDGDVPREVRGEFTLRGVSEGVTLKNLHWRCALNPIFRREVCGGDFEGELKRSAFGITHSLPFVADRVQLEVQIEAIRQ